MKSLRNVLGLHFSTLILFGLLFPVAVWGIAQLFPESAGGFPVYKNGKLIGYENIGQKFTNPKYFWGRPSAVDYNAGYSGGSNKGPANPAYLKLIQGRIDTLLKYNPGIKKSDIPSDLVTASGSGLDPHISPQAAFIQIPRIANERKLSRASLRKLVEEHAEPPLFGIFGPRRVNVLELNLALDNRTNVQSRSTDYSPRFPSRFRLNEADASAKRVNLCYRLIHLSSFYYIDLTSHS
jgi:K+-transporting ATPase ATPase C chain